MTRNEIFPPILVVEDEEDHARLIKKALTSEGPIVNEIHHVENGQEAIDYLKRQGKYINLESYLPALILLDVKMPMKNGFEVLEEIKSHEILRLIPVVMLTTSSTTEDIEKALELGANDYIVKPVKFSDFHNKVSKIGYYWGLISDIYKYK
jgi:two-component system, response regulator